MARQVNGHLGTFASIEALTAKFPPSESIGCSANVGTTAPYIKYWCDGQTWAGVDAAAIQSLVSEAGNITAAELATTTGTLGQTVRLSDGDNKGAILMWSTPAGSSTPAWCWWLWPQSPYET